MSRLKAQFSPAFARDIKHLKRKHFDTTCLAEVIDLIVENTPNSIEALRHRHRMHSLAGKWAGSSECHVCNAGDWLLIWRTFDDIALMQRTGTHDELFS